MKKFFNLGNLIRVLLVGMIVFLAVNLLMGGIAAGSTEPGPEDYIAGTVELPPEALSLASLDTSGLPSAEHPKLDSTMASLAADSKVSSQAALENAKALQVPVLEERVQAQLTTDAAQLQAALEAINQAGGEVTGVAFENTLIQGWIPVTAIERLAQIESIFYIQKPITAVLDDIAATTEGLAVMNGSNWHAAGFNGSGAKIAVIDGGFTGYTALKGTDIPSSVIVKNFVDGETDAQVDGTTKHGTACAEIVYDIAPGATLYLGKINTTVDLEEAVNWAKSNNVDVISTSLSFFNTAPGDGTGYLVNLVQSAKDAGIVWAKSMGNYRELHWGGLWRDNNSNNFHEFTSGGQEINFFGPGDGSAYNLNSGYYFQVHLRWNNWGNPTQDYDLHAVRWNGSSWQIIASSTNPQTGSGGQKPTESLVAQTTGDSAPYGVIIERVNSNQTVNFELLVPGWIRFDEVVNARSFGDPADAPAIMSVAALDVVSPYSQEIYSSEGPTNGPGGAETGGFTKPDISGFANVSTESYGAGGFNGTSSATPHVAGAAALVAGAFPSYTPDQVQNYLEGHAIDMGPGGMDNLYGYGRLYLGDPPGPVADKIWNGSVSNNWHTAGNWTPSGVPTSSETVLIPDTNRDPVVSSSNGASKDLTVDPNAVLDLTTRTVTVEGVVLNNGVIKQTANVSLSSTTNFVRLKNQAGNQTKYYGVDITPTNIGQAFVNQTVVQSEPSWLEKLVSGIGSWIESLFSSGSTTSQTGVSEVAVINPQSNSGIVNVSYNPGSAQMADNDPVPGRPVELKLESQPVINSVQAPMAGPSSPDADVSLVLDDAGLEAAFGVNDSNYAYQFIWLNRFTPNPANYPFVLDEIWVMFSDNAGTWDVDVGDAVDIVVYQDADGNPINGATHLATINETIQAVSGTTWSKYNLSTPINLNGPGDVLIAVIDRFVESGVTPKTYMATIDQTSSQNRSYIGWWNADPPNPANLPPDNTFVLMDGDNAGNWLIRGYGETTGGAPTPTATSTATPTSTPTTTLTPTPTATLTPQPGDTTVTVSVYGNQFCAGRATGVERCYDIESSNSMTATVRYYFTEVERRGIVKQNLLLYHYMGSWQEEPGPYSNGGSGDAQYVQVQNVDDFSLFALDQKRGGPYLPITLKLSPEPKGPDSGFWKDGSDPGTEFYVTLDRQHVDNFAIKFCVSGCGCYTITRTTEVEIANNQFSFGGAFYASGTFDSNTAAHGNAGLDNFPISGCGNISGSHNWNAVWINSSQPLVIEGTIQVEEIELLTPANENIYKVVPR